MASLHYKMNELANRVLRTVPGARVKLSVFPSGQIMLDVWRYDRVFIMDCLLSGKFGVDEVLEDEGFGTGYRHVIDDFESASARMLDLVCMAEPAPMLRATAQ